MTDEIWKPIPGYDGYEASNLGRIRSWKTRGKVGITAKSPHVLKPAIDKTTGYHGVGLGRGVFKRVHQLVLLAFVGPRLNGLKALHNDDDRNNNSLDNLRYGTQAENIQDMIKNHNGKHPRKMYTVAMPPSKSIKRDDFIQIYNASNSLDEICKKTGLKRKTVMEEASRLRRFGYELKFFQVKVHNPYRVKRLSQVKKFQILLSWQSGLLTNEEVMERLKVDYPELLRIYLEAIETGKST